MTGLLVLMVVAVWFGVASMVAIRIASRLRAPLARSATTLLAFLALFLAPVADEIVGGFQFRSLCSDGANFRLHVSNLRGRVARLSIDRSDVSGTAVPIDRSQLRYVDASTGETILDYDRYEARGGALAHALNFGGHPRPLIIEKAACSPGHRAAHSEFGFSLVE